MLGDVAQVQADTERSFAQGQQRQRQQESQVNHGEAHSRMRPGQGMIRCGEDVNETASCKDPSTGLPSTTPAEWRKHCDDLLASSCA